jgi:hypothetical protein
MGIEPTSEAWEASILPLYDARSLQTVPLGTNQIIHKRGTLNLFPLALRRFPGFRRIVALTIDRGNFAAHRPQIG